MKQRYTGQQKYISWEKNDRASFLTHPSGFMAGPENNHCMKYQIALRLNSESVL